MSQNPRQLRQPRTTKELVDSVNLATFRVRFEAGRSFDLEDDMEFCPRLLTDADVSTTYHPHAVGLQLLVASPATSPRPEP